MPQTKKNAKIAPPPIMDDIFRAAIISGDIKTVKVIAKDQSQLHLPDQDGLMPLHLACLNNQLLCATALIHYGADINANSPQGTPEQIAIRQRSTEMLRLLNSRQKKQELPSIANNPHALLSSIIVEGEAWELINEEPEGDDHTFEQLPSGKKCCIS